MAYKNFKEKQLKDDLGVTPKVVELFDTSKIPTVEPSPQLLRTLLEAQLITLSTEKALSERIISPVLAEVKKNNLTRIQIFSGEILNADAERGLNGEIDFIFTRLSDTISPQAPIICVTEAKIGRLDKAIPQASAQMVGARVFNKKNGDAVETIHGVITDGSVWRFLKLEGNTILIDKNQIFQNDLAKLLGVFQKIVDFYY